MQQLLQLYKKEMNEELMNILSYWEKFAIDEKMGGFVGQIDLSNNIIPLAPKGVVLNARILWTYAAAQNFQPNHTNLAVAQRAYDYLLNYFIDKKMGGVYWSVDYSGNPLDKKKQVYAISFVIYSLAEYFKCTNDDRVKQEAIQLYQLIIEHAYDKHYGGFIEALTEDWKPIQDFRLSNKDANTPKSMNTLLHVLEAFTNLYKIWPVEPLYHHIQKLLLVFTKYVINPNNFHLHLFFNNNWSVIGNDISFGHDIEASWLLLEAAMVIDNEQLITQFKKLAVAMSTATIKGLDEDGGLWYEAHNNYNTFIYEKHWWPQAESMIGFFNAFQITNDTKFLELSWNSWDFVKNNLKDKQGEWYWGIQQNGEKINKDKAGFWKCPYHNGRACIEIINRINAVLSSK